MGVMLSDVSTLGFREESGFQQVPGSGIGGDSKRGWAAWPQVQHEDLSEAR